MGIHRDGCFDQFQTRRTLELSSIPLIRFEISQVCEDYERLFHKHSPLPPSGRSGSTAIPTYHTIANELEAAAPDRKSAGHHIQTPRFHLTGLTFSDAIRGAKLPAASIQKALNLCSLH